MTPQTDIIAVMDAQAEQLLKTATGTTIPATPSGEVTPPVDMKDRIEAFKAVTAYLVVRGKLAPEDEGKSGIDKLRDRVNGGRRTPGRRAHPPAGSEDGSGADSRAPAPE